jgi:hypothetical protein
MVIVDFAATAVPGIANVKVVVVNMTTVDQNLIAIVSPPSRPLHFRALL